MSDGGSSASALFDEYETRAGLVGQVSADTESGETVGNDRRPSIIIAAPTSSKHGIASPERRTHSFRSSRSLQNGIKAFLFGNNNSLDGIPHSKYLSR